MSRTQAHYFRQWIDGGETSLDNLGLLCLRHHKMNHEGGWTLVLTDKRRLLVIPPPSRAWMPWTRAPDRAAAR